ncbi:hypothetical protein C8R44DRAFT_747032 [Mycena epipterygia]|nr:hypothetical protein C8R44DRAFT_747032 [Mycena epipterygia]
MVLPICALLGRRRLVLRGVEQVGRAHRVHGAKPLQDFEGAGSGFFFPRPTVFTGRCSQRPSPPISPTKDRKMEAVVGHVVVGWVWQGGGTKERESAYQIHHAPLSRGMPATTVQNDSLLEDESNPILAVNPLQTRAEFKKYSYSNKGKERTAGLVTNCATGAVHTHATRIPTLYSLSYYLCRTFVLSTPAPIPLLWLDIWRDLSFLHSRHSGAPQPHSGPNGVTACKLAEKCVSSTTPTATPAPPPVGSASAPPLSVQRSDTVTSIPPTGSQGGLSDQVAATNQGSVSSGPISTSASSGPSSSFLPPGPTAARNFTTDVGLRPLVPDDKKLDTKPELHGGLQREVHAATQGVAEHIRWATDTANSQGGAIGILQNDLNDMSARLNDITATLQRIEARQTSIPMPMPDVATFFSELTTSLKRRRSPSPVRDGRVVRAHLEDENALPTAPPVASNAPPAPIFAAPPASTSSTLPPGVTAVSMASTMPATAYTLPAGVITTAAAVPVFVAPTVSRKGKATTPVLRYPARVVRLGPGQWDKDITAQALIIIRAVLPNYVWDNVFIRAHRV